MQTLKPFTNTFSQFGPNELSLKILAKRLTMNWNSGFFLATSEWVLVMFEWHWHPKIISPKKFDNTINTIKCKYNTNKNIFKRYKYTSQRPQLPKYLGWLIQSLHTNLEKMVWKNKIKRYYGHLSHYMYVFDLTNWIFPWKLVDFLSLVLHSEHFSGLYTN